MSVNDVGFAQQLTSLPTINLPTFSGSYNEWIPFRDLFKSLIHNKLELAQIQKLHYLKSCLAVEAAKTIESVSLTSEFHATAWDLLKKRYEKSRFIIESHVKLLIKLENINKSNMRTCLDEIYKTIRALDALGQNANAGDTLIIQMFVHKMEKQLREE